MTVEHLAVGDQVALLKPFGVVGVFRVVDVCGPTLTIDDRDRSTFSRKTGGRWGYGVSEQRVEPVTEAHLFHVTVRQALDRIKRIEPSPAGLELAQRVVDLLQEGATVLATEMTRDR